MWKAFYKDTLEYVEEGRPEGRPVKDGNKGLLALVAEEEYHHRIAVDLLHGIIFIDYDALTPQNGDIGIENPKTVLHICNETNVVGDIKTLITTEPNEHGWYSQIEEDLVWKPIWFIRHIHSPAGYFIVKCVGAKTKLPKEYGGKTIKMFVSIFPDGRVGITA